MTPEMIRLGYKELPTCAHCFRTMAGHVGPDYCVGYHHVTGEAFLMGPRFLAAVEVPQ